jgi:hypothetical protein
VSPSTVIQEDGSRRRAPRATPCGRCARRAAPGCRWRRVDRRGAHDDELLRLAPAVIGDGGRAGRPRRVGGLLGRAGLCGASAWAAASVPFAVGFPASAPLRPFAVVPSAFLLRRFFGGVLLPPSGAAARCAAAACCGGLLGPPVAAACCCCWLLLLAVVAVVGCCCGCLLLLLLLLLLLFAARVSRWSGPGALDPGEHRAPRRRRRRGRRAPSPANDRGPRPGAACRAGLHPPPGSRDALPARPRTGAAGSPTPRTGRPSCRGGTAGRACGAMGIGPLFEVCRGTDRVDRRRRLVHTVRSGAAAYPRRTARSAGLTRHERRRVRARRSGWPGGNCGGAAGSASWPTRGRPGLAIAPAARRALRGLRAATRAPRTGPPPGPRRSVRTTWPFSTATCRVSQRWRRMVSSACSLMRAMIHETKHVSRDEEERGRPPAQVREQLGRAGELPPPASTAAKIQFWLISECTMNAGPSSSVKPLRPLSTIV